MSKRSNHYEAAFEEYLRERRVPYVATDERTGPRFPLLLTTGRILSQFPDYLQDGQKISDDLAELGELAHQNVFDAQQVTRVVHGVLEHRRRERALGPIGFLVGFGEHDAEVLFDDENGRAA